MVVRRHLPHTSLVAAAVWLAVLALGVNMGRLLAARWSMGIRTAEGPVSQGPIKTTPYTVYYRFSSGKNDYEGTSIKAVALASNGSMVRQLEVLDRQPPVSSRLIQLASGTVVSTNDILEWKRTRPEPVAVRAIVRDPATQCLKTFADRAVLDGEQITGQDWIAGFPTLIVKSRLGTVWLAPDLGCAELKIRILSPTGSVIEQTVTTVRTGEPDPALFAVGPHYREVSLQQLVGR
jgi:hypothetical protein